MRIASEATELQTAPVCLPCKLRHRKCDRQELGCSQCKALAIECVSQPSLKFRYHPLQKVLSGASPGAWRPYPILVSPIQFYDETPGLRAVYRHSPLPRETHPASPAYGSSDQAVFATNPTASGMDPGQAGDGCSRKRAPYKCGFDAASPLIHIEAVLLRNFVHHMAQWTDIADPHRTFEFEVSRLALTDQVLRYAICAFSARHYYRCLDGEDRDDTALDYQNRCLDLLLPSMSGRSAITETVLTAVALLRQNEEMDGQCNPSATRNQDQICLDRKADVNQNMTTASTSKALLAS